MTSSAVDLQTVVQCAAGAEHLILRTADGKLCGFGDASKCQIGAGLSVSAIPEGHLCQPFDGSSSHRAVSVSCGFTHSVCVSSDGSAFSCGRNMHGQCGIPSKELIQSFERILHLIVPRAYAVQHQLSVIGDDDARLKLLHGWEPSDHAVSEDWVVVEHTSSSLQFVEVACGWTHSVLLTSTGHCFTFGWNTPLPKLQHALWKMAASISTIACGSWHSLYLDGSSGAVFSEGTNTYGQLMNGNCENVHDSVATVRLADPDQKVVALAHGPAYHSLCVDESGHVWAAGKGDISNGAFYGLLGDDSDADSCTPKIVEHELSNVHIAGAACGWEHSFAYTADARLYAWGSNVYGQCGAGEQACLSTPAMVLDASQLPEFAGKRAGVTSICAGRAFSCVVLREASPSVQV
jgi:alpha-tubulin suppressor-like RCC1 family protein